MGDVILFEVEAKKIPFVHRVIQVIQWRNGTYQYMTKGDNNEETDQKFYKGGAQFLESEDIKGRVFASIPWAGQFSLLLSEVPIFRFVVLGLIGLLFLVSKGGIA